MDFCGCNLIALFPSFFNSEAAAMRGLLMRRSQLHRLLLSPRSLIPKTQSNFSSDSHNNSLHLLPIPSSTPATAAAEEANVADLSGIIKDPKTVAALADELKSNPFIHHDLQSMINRYYKRSRSVWSEILKEILHRHDCRMNRRHSHRINRGRYCNTPRSCMPFAYYIEGSCLVVPKNPDTGELETEGSAGRDAGEWRKIICDYRPSCFELLKRKSRWDLVNLSVELRDMCERGEFKWEEAYDLLKQIAEDMGKDPNSYD